MEIFQDHICMKGIRFPGQILCSNAQLKLRALVHLSTTVRFLGGAVSSPAGPGQSPGRDPGSGAPGSA